MEFFSYIIIVIILYIAS